MKQPSVKSSSPTARCEHLTASGRRCRQLVAGPHEKLCFHHRALQQAKQAADLSGPLLSESQGFQTAQGINFALTNLYELLAADRISARRAAVLAHINSLLLRTLPAIDADAEAGILDPTLPEKVVKSEATVTANSPVSAIPRTDSAAENASSWDSSVPDPDPTRKPS
jgi:hypothetical protein